ncbi:MAG: hypothetical protein ABEJ83_00960 [Candidatus Nanohaloarchaea archaeon]
MQESIQSDLETIVTADQKVVESLNDGVIKEEVKNIRVLWKKARKGREDTTEVSC